MDEPDALKLMIGASLPADVSFQLKVIIIIIIIIIVPVKL